MPGELSLQSGLDSHPPGGSFIDLAEKVLALGLLVVVVYLASTEPLTWVPFALAGVAGAVLLVVRWPNGALSTLMLAAAIPRFSMTISSWHAEAEHFAVAACGLLLLVRLQRGKQTWKKLERAEIILLLFLAANFFSSSVASPAPSQTVRWALLQAIAMGAFFLVGQMVDSERRLEQAMKILLCVGAAEAIFGIMCFLSYLLFGTKLGVTQFSYLSFIPGIHGSQWEPNIFGSYNACFAVMFLFYFFTARRNNGLYFFGFLLSTIAVLLSLARQGWVCVGFVGALVVLYSQRGRKIQWRRLAPLLAGLSIALFAAVTLMPDLPERLETLAVSKVMEDTTTLHRLKNLALAVDDITHHPLIGTGTSSFQLFYTDEDEFGQGSAWLGSLFIRVVHDTGILGMAILLWFLLHLIRRAWRILAHPARSETAIAVGALSAGVLVMLMAYQLTDASTLTFTWIQFGLFAVALRLATAGQMPGTRVEL